ncbi:2-hydroxyacyl-CoA dehydratase [Phenylobacterium terrae]|uniref:2-hydroxyacyl-CoA dehydratase n=1 Tax=Phenylobacterium terrae TaxID=2665495 RepID=A0ABW4MV98_9CAUL
MTFQPFHDAARDPDAAARAFKGAGGKVVGYMGATVPTELIAAAGAFPLRLVELRDATPLADRYMEPQFDPLVRGVFEKLLEGGYAFLDAIVLPRTSDSVQRFYYYLCEVRRTGEADLPEPILYDLLHTPWYSSAEYNFARTGELKAALERITGASSDLKARIADANRRRGRIAALAELRRAAPAKVAGLDARAAMLAQGLMAAASFDAALDAAIAQAGAALRGPRVVIAGSGLASDGLHRRIEAAGAVVVGDFHEFGEPAFDGRVDEAAEPVRAIAQHYHRQVLSSRTFPVDPNRLADFAEAARADGVVFWFDAVEEALTWEQPAQQRALQARGVPCLRLQGEAPPDSVERFVARLPARALA